MSVPDMTAYRMVAKPVVKVCKPDTILLTKQTYDELSFLLEEAQSIKTLDMSLMQYTSSEWRQIIAGFRNSTTLTELTIADKPCHGESRLPFHYETHRNRI